MPLECVSVDCLLSSRGKELGVPQEWFPSLKYLGPKTSNVMFIFILHVKLGETPRMQKGASEGRQISAPDAAADGLCDCAYVLTC